MSTKIKCNCTLCLYQNHGVCCQNEVEISSVIPKCLSFVLSKERFEAFSEMTLAYTQEELNKGIDERDEKFPFLQ